MISPILVGFTALNQGHQSEAVEVFKLNAEVFPGSANVYDSLGEALLKKGEKEAAASNYRKSLELNPNNENAKKVLKTIEEGG